MRNHGGASQWHRHMDYESMALDVHAYLEQTGITRQDKSVNIVGHSMGGKTAITLACLFPNLVNSLVSLDSPPVDRNPFTHMNQDTSIMIETALSLGDLQHLGNKGAVAHVKAEVSDPEV
jgi:pimeloyl-ACP methyl ester carboxylesterase